jgi:hypothetical protein
MAKLRRAVERRLAYAPRFLRNYRNRRQIGCTPAVAFRSARERMRQPTHDRVAAVRAGPEDGDSIAALIAAVIILGAAACPIFENAQERLVLELCVAQVSRADSGAR